MRVALVKLFPALADPTAPGIRQKVGVLSGLVGIGCNLLIAAVKLAVGLSAGSLSIVADALNNVGDMASSVVTLIGFRLSGKPADPEHPFGHGRAEYMGGFIVALFICLMGVELFRTSLGRIDSAEPMAISVFTLAVLVAGMLVKLFMFSYNRALADITRSAALRGTAMDSLTDVAATGTVLLSALVYRYGGIQVDAYVGMGVAGFIVYTGIRTAMETGDLLLGQYTDPAVLTQITRRVESFDPRILGVHDLMVHSYGPGRRFAYLDLELPSGLPPQEAHDLIDACEREVGRAMGLTLRIHMDPVDTDDRLLERLRGEVARIVEEAGGCRGFHDLRLSGEGHRELSFDLILPYKQETNEAETIEAIASALRESHPELRIRIGIDRDLSPPGF